MKYARRTAAPDACAVEIGVSAYDQDVETPRPEERRHAAGRDVVKEANQEVRARVGFPIF